MLTHEGQHTQCAYTLGLARDAAPPLESPASRPAAGAPHRARTAQRRTAAVAGDFTAGQQVAVDQPAEALRLQNAGE